MNGHPRSGTSQLSFSRTRVAGMASLLVVLAGCASQTARPDAARTTPRVEAPSTGEHYLIYYLDENGLRLRDTRTGVDSALLPAGGAVAWRASPSGNRVAVAFPRRDSAVLAVVDVETGAWSSVDTEPRAGTFTFGWSARGRLGVGYEPPPGGDGGAVLVVEPRGGVRSMGCRASDRFVSWRADGTAVVSDGDNMYTVDSASCRTLATLPGRGKSQITFSPDGSRVAFYRMAPVGYRDRTVSQPELFIASYDGANAKKIADPQFRPRNARWSPDGSKIAFEIQSQRFANVFHVAVHDVRTGRISFSDQERELGLPSDGNPCWSPDGRMIAHDRRYTRRSDVQSYITRQKVIKTVADGSERVVLEELVPEGRDAANQKRCGWIDAQHLVVTTADGPKIVNLGTRATYAVANGLEVLLVEVYPLASPGG